MLTFAEHSKRKGGNTDETAQPLSKGASHIVHIGRNSKKEQVASTSKTSSKQAKLLQFLASIGVSEEHIPRATKQIDDLVEQKHGKKNNGNNDSSIEEPDVDVEAARLDEFEALFRVAPTAADPTKSAVDASATDFKIQRKAKEDPAKVIMNGMKVKVSGGIQPAGSNGASALPKALFKAEQGADVEMKDE